MYRPTSRHEWLFCGALLAQAIIILALELFIISEWQMWVHSNITQVTISYVVPINLAIFVFTCVYELILAIDAVHHKNNLLLFAVCVSNVCILAFSAMQPTAMIEISRRLPNERDAERQPLVDIDVDFWKRVGPAQIACPIVFGICSFIIWPCAYRLHKEYAWAIYRSIHGDLSIKTRFLAYEIYLVLIKLDFYFITVFVIQYDLIDVHFEGPEFALTLALLPASFLMMVLAVWFVRKEWKIAMIPVIICHAAIIAYLISRIVVLYDDGRRANTADKDMMLLFAFAALILMAFTLICAVICVFNFNHGLREVLDEKSYKRDTHFEALSGWTDRSYSPEHRLSLE
ncbi:uncharacterized protein N7496_010827 [Penicillium cataractarum]|uniref:Uncharacterized protein n=1 Tax=Penicillium cataractarum TaxID=2100454 RepID=A0A9W9RGD9_9EURO|nr:uncharacterized protein N7496_010827 [Penicillium cataractarum]KAJ5358414.1 hypothetical protein N7496_010827 [Penicillium cataractarum]